MTDSQTNKPSAAVRQGGTGRQVPPSQVDTALSATGEPARESNSAMSETVVNLGGESQDTTVMDLSSRTNDTAIDFGTSVHPLQAADPSSAGPTSPQVACPSREELLQFAANPATEEPVPVFRHLQECPHCQIIVGDAMCGEPITDAQRGEAETYFRSLGAGGKG